MDECPEGRDVKCTREKNSKKQQIQCGVLHGPVCCYQWQKIKSNLRQKVIYCGLLVCTSAVNEITAECSQTANLTYSCPHIYVEFLKIKLFLLVSTLCTHVHTMLVQCKGCFQCYPLKKRDFWNQWHKRTFTSLSVNVNLGHIVHWWDGCYIVYI